MNEVETDDIGAIAETPQPAKEIYALGVWAKANGIGLNTAYEYCRRTIDPLPHIKQGTRYLVEPGPALAWMRRKFGIGYQDVA